MDFILMIWKCFLIFLFSFLTWEKQESKELIENKPSKEIGQIQIEKIHLNQSLYPIGSEENTIEKHVEILKESTPPDEENSIFLLAAHSGEGDIAYFEELDQLEIGDTLVLWYQKKKYEYQVIEIWEEEKNGWIHINKRDEKQLILTTCHPTKAKKQLIVNAIIKES